MAGGEDAAHHRYLGIECVSRWRMEFVEGVEVDDVVVLLGYCAIRKRCFVSKRRESAVRIKST